MVNTEEILYREFGCEYQKGDVVFKEGEPGQLVYIIQSGKIEISKSVGNRSKVLAILSRGDFFGEMALISERPRSATATALETCRLMALNSDMFYKILRSNYDITLSIIEQLAARLAESDKRLEVLLFADATTRLVKQLETVNTDAVDTGMPQLAYDLGVPLERLQRITNKLEEKGIIEIHENGLSIIDRGKLLKLKNYLFLKEEFGQIE